MRIEEILREEFEIAWRSKTYRSISDSLNLIKGQFEIERVDSFINESIRISDDRSFRERYHRRNLKELAKLFADELYYTSDSGRNINARTVNEAIDSMKGKGPCDTYPCSNR